MPFPLIPLLIAGGALALAVAAGKKGQVAARGGPEDEEPEPGPVDPSSLPIDARPGYAAARRSYDFVMGGAVTDPDYLRRVAKELADSGFPELASEVLAKLSRLTGVVAIPVPTPTTPETLPPPPAAGPATTPPVVPPPVGTTPPSPIEVEPAEEEGGEIPEAEPADEVPRAEPPPTAAPPGPVAPPPAAIPPVAAAETAPEVDPKGTILLARTLIARESGAGWKDALQPEVQAWQARVGLLSPDGKFGTGSAVRMGEEVGILPKVRFFSKQFWEKNKAVEDFRAKIRALADRIEPTNAAHAQALRISADAETGQAWPAAPAPISQEERAIETSVRNQMAERLAREETGEEYGTRTTEEG